jgi:hypothetical protein
MAAHGGMVASVVESRCIAAVLQVASGAGWFAKNPHPSYSCKSPSIFETDGLQRFSLERFSKDPSDQRMSQPMARGF